jgi:hypothetical protein
MFLTFGSHEEKLLRSAQVAARPIEKPLTIPTIPSLATVQNVLRSTFRPARRLARIVLASIPPDFVTDTRLVLHFSGNPGGFDRSMQHHLKDLLFKDGVYDPEETVEAFSHARN